MFKAKGFLSILVFVSIFLFSSCAKEIQLSVSNLSSIGQDSIEITFKGIDTTRLKSQDLPHYDTTLGKRVIDICPYWENNDSLCYYLKHSDKNLKQIWNLQAIDAFFYHKVSVDKFTVISISEENNKKYTPTCNNFLIYKKSISKFDLVVPEAKSPLTDWTIKIAPSQQIVFHCDIVGDRSCNVSMSNFSDTIIFKINNKTKILKSHTIDSILSKDGEILFSDLNLKINN